jgi:subtilisin family serine protease
VNVSIRLAVLTVLFSAAAASAGALAQSASGADAPMNDGRYIIKMRASGSSRVQAAQGDDSERGRRAASAAGGLVVGEVKDQKSVVALLSDAGRQRLESDAEIESVEPDYRRYPQLQSKPFGITMVQADDPFLLAAAASQASSDVMVCIIDSGYQQIHEDLSGNSNVTGVNNTGTGQWNVDTCGHGSHVAGTIAAVDNNVGVVGVNGNGRLNLHIQKVFDGSTCAWTYASTLTQAVTNCRTAATNGGKKLVISMSLGGAGSTTAENTAFQTAYNAGVLSIAAAGNAGTSAVSYPAGYSSVMSVAAVDATSAKASFSQFNSDVEIAAPGVGTVSTTPFATPFVTSGGENTRASIYEGSGTGAATGALVHGGLCSAAGAWTGAVVLCDRGTNSFLQKTDAVIAGGGVGVIIANNVAGEFSGTLGTGITRAVPVVGLTLDQGVTLRTAAGQSVSVTVPTGTGNGYESYDGTSMATPHVAGVAGLIWGLQPTRSNVQVRQALIGSAKDLGTAGRDTSFGYGLVQAKAAYDYLLNPPAAPVYSSDSSSVPFTAVAVGVTGPETLVKLTNTGTVAVPLTSVALSGTNANQFVLRNACGSSIAIGATCNVGVSFKPTSTGNKTATLTITGGSGAPTTTVALTGTGINYTFTRTPTSISFARTNVGATSAATTVTVRNTSTGGLALPLTAGSVRLAGTNPTQYTLVTNRCTAPLAANATCTFSVAFKPTSTGSKPATMVVAPTGVTAQSGNLTGTGR